MIDEQLAEIRARCERADYVHYGRWGGKPTDAYDDIDRLLNEVARLRVEIERAHQFLDECGGGGNGTEPLIERIGMALATAREEVALLRAENARLRAIIMDTASELSPDCPDTSTYVDGSCDLVDTASCVMAELDNLKRAPMCEHPGCPKRAELECTMPPICDDEAGSVHPLCFEHAEAEGFCVGCGQFWCGIEAFDFDPAHLCPNCRDQMVDPEDGEDDEIPF